MPSAAPKIAQKHILAYYESLKSYDGQGVTHETAVRSAFQNLLAETGQGAATGRSSPNSP